MKQLAYCLLILVVFVPACKKDSVKETYSFYRPVYQTKTEVRASIRNTEPQSIQNAGKIVWKDQFIFLNDVDRGVHVINISNPKLPKQVSFIKIPGCVDLAINGTILYADCYTDLVTIDISDPLHVVTKQFLPGVFPQRAYSMFRPDTNRVIVDWIKIDTVINNGWKDQNFYSTGFFFAQSAAPGASGPAGFGLAGSMSRFGLLDQRLYTVSSSDLKVFNISNAASPNYVSTVAMGVGGIETIFPYKNNLFIGSTTGMFVYSAQNPDKPQRTTQFQHARSCDPVIADDKYAYVTLRGNGRCGGPSNQLDILDITTITAPKVITSYALQSPAGLSKDGNLLFICDGLAGLKAFNITNPGSPAQLKQIGGFDAYDVIADGGIAIVVADNGLHLVDYSNPAAIKEVGNITVAK